MEPALRDCSTPKRPECTPRPGSPPWAEAGAHVATQARRGPEVARAVSASEPPTPLPVQSSTTPAPSPIASASPEDKIKELENHIESNKKRFAKRQADASRHIASFERRYKDDPERVKELRRL